MQISGVPVSGSEDSSVEQNGTRSGSQWIRLWNESDECAPGNGVQRLDLGGAAVDEELDAVDETGVARGEEEGDGCDLFRASDFAARDLGFEELLGIGSEGIEDRRVDSARAEDVHANSSLLELDQPGAREGAHGRFAGAVDAERR